MPRKAKEHKKKLKTPRGMNKENVDKKILSVEKFDYVEAYETIKKVGELEVVKKQKEAVDEQSRELKRNVLKDFPWLSIEDVDWNLDKKQLLQIAEDEAVGNKIRLYPCLRLTYYVYRFVSNQFEIVEVYPHKGVFYKSDERGLNEYPIAERIKKDFLRNIFMEDDIITFTKLDHALCNNGIQFLRIKDFMAAYTYYYDMNNLDDMEESERFFAIDYLEAENLNSLKSILLLNLTRARY